MGINTSSTSGSYFIKENLDSGLVDGVLRKTPFINKFREMGRIVPNGGAATVEWNWCYADQEAASSWGENDTISTFGGTLTVRASKAPTYAKMPFGVSDYQLANAKNGGLTTADIVGQEAGKATESLFKYFEDQFCGSGAGVGISSLVDSTGNVEGVNQATYTQWASVENTASGSSFLATIDDTYFDLMSRNTSLSDVVIFCSPAVANIYSNTASGSLRGMFGGPTTDYGKGELTYQGRPIVPCPGMSDAEMYFIDMSDAEIRVTIEPEAEEIAVANMGANFCVRGAMAFIVKDRRKHAKILGVDSRTS